MQTRREIEAALLSEYLTHNNIAKEAYRLWEKEGRPDGSQMSDCGMTIAQLHWLRARMVLEILVEFDTGTIECFESMRAK